MRAELMSLTEVIGEDCGPERRLAGLGPDARRTYAGILRAFVHAHVPLANEQQADRTVLGRLVQRDLVVLGPEGEFVVAYPFSARPTRHRVHVDGRDHWAMCAIDALGIPYLLRRPAEIEGREPAAGRLVTVAIDPGTGTLGWDPPAATVVAACAGAGSPATCACPHINLFATATAAERYLTRSGLRGTTLTVSDAAEAARRLFGGLHEALSSPAWGDPGACGEHRDEARRSG